jgi:predicted 3-demethylubiquinone-9 3-methyltransferase (glyoxalase superfamily)
MSDPKITPYLWFDDDAEEAIAFYSTIFPDARVIDEQRYPEGAPGPAGTLMTATFELAGQRFVALNGGPAFDFTEAVSFFIRCDSAEEVDHYWDALLADGGEPSQCGWLKDKFGLSWQVVPGRLMEYLSDPDPVKAQRVMQAMLQMSKIEVSELDAAYAGE